MTSEEGIAQIDSAEWVKDEYEILNMHVTDPKGRDVHAFLSLRPVYCDRGHIQLNINGYLNLDSSDSFPRFFFSFEEADKHTRTFLKWRLWKHRTYPHQLREPPGPTPLSPEEMIRKAIIRKAMEEIGITEDQEDELMAQSCQVGERAGAVASINDGKAVLLGYGVYQGYQVPDRELNIRGMFGPMTGPNPCILLDSGEKTYGCECWWGPEDKIKKLVEVCKQVEIVSPSQFRKQNSSED